MREWEQRDREVMDKELIMCGRKWREVINCKSRGDSRASKKDRTKGEKLINTPLQSLI